MLPNDDIACAPTRGRQGDALQGEAALRGTWGPFSRRGALSVVCERAVWYRRCRRFRWRSRDCSYVFFFVARHGGVASIYTGSPLFVASPWDGVLLCLRCLFFFVFVVWGHTAIMTLVVAGSPKWFCYPGGVSRRRDAALVATTYQAHTKREQYHRRPFATLNAPSALPACAEE